MCNYHNAQNNKFCIKCGAELESADKKEHKKSRIEIKHNSKSKNYLERIVKNRRKLTGLVVVIIAVVSFFVVWAIISASKDCPYECCTYGEFNTKQCLSNYNCENNTCIKRDCPYDCCVEFGDFKSKSCNNGLKCINNTCKCVTDWDCPAWSTCSRAGAQTRTCTDRNNCGVATNKPTESQSCTPPKIKEASLEINRVQITVANLYPTRVTVRNTGNVDICPKFDIYVYKGSKEVCSGSPIFSGFDCLSPNEEKTDEISLMGCIFRVDGTYTLKIDLLDSEYNLLDSETEDFTVDYWGQFDFQY